MDKTIKNRSEIDQEYLWDLSIVFKDDEEWYQTLSEVKEKIKQYETYQGTFMDSATNLYQLLKLDQEVSRTLSRLNTYSNSKSDEDKRNNSYLKMTGDLDQVYSVAATNSAYIVPTLMKYQYSKIEEFMNEEPKLKEFERSLKEIFRYKPYVLDEKEEKILSEYSQVFQVPSNLYDILSNSDLNLGTVLNDEGNEVELTDTNFIYYLRSKNRAFRKRVFEKVYETYRQFTNTFATTLAGMIDYSCIDAKVRGYQSSIESYLFPDKMPKEAYDNLIQSVNDGLPILMKYFDLKKKELGLDEIHIYDLYVDLVKTPTREYTFEEAKQLVMDAMSVLGDDYKRRLQDAFDNHWIDVYPNHGKASGAYSGGSYDTPPYVLLNYMGTLEDVSTLAHELGHSMHSYYTRENNPYETGDYSIFVAEVASTVNELLLAKYLLKTTDDKNLKRSILAHLMDMFKATIYRQVMFAEFEKQIHEKREEGEVLTSEMISHIYLELVKKYHEPVVKVDDDIQFEWERISHFYTPFYVYKYATGLASACQIVTDILDGKEHAVDNYISFLKDGSKHDPIDTLKIAGVDVLSKDTMVSALRMFEDFIEEYQELNGREVMQYGKKRLL